MSVITKTFKKVPTRKELNMAGQSWTKSNSSDTNKSSNSKSNKKGK